MLIDKGENLLVGKVWLIANDLEEVYQNFLKKNDLVDSDISIKLFKNQYDKGK